MVERDEVSVKSKTKKLSRKLDYCNVDGSVYRTRVLFSYL